MALSIGIIGCGHMGGAIAQAILDHGARTLWIGTPHAPRLKDRRKAVHWSANNREVAASSDLLIIGVRPFVVKEVLGSLRADIKKRHIILSIAAGISLKNLSTWSGGHKKIVRVMPNLASQVGDGISLWRSIGLSATEKKSIKKLLALCGRELEVQDEKFIDSGTQVSGCGPAYVAAFLESMEAYMIKSGFSKSDARVVALQTVAGTLHYIEKSGVEFKALKEAVQTKGGVTEAGFKVLKKKKWQRILAQSFEAGYKRTIELSRNAS